MISHIVIFFSYICGMKGTKNIPVDTIIRVQQEWVEKRLRDIDEVARRQVYSIRNEHYITLKGIMMLLNKKTDHAVRTVRDNSGLKGFVFPELTGSKQKKVYPLDDVVNALPELITPPPPLKGR